jgi:hypothetical protein
LTASAWRIEELLVSALQAPFQGCVLADHTDRGGGRDHGHRAVVAVHQHDVGPSIIAAYFDVGIPPATRN